MLIGIPHSAERSVPRQELSSEKASWRATTSHPTPTKARHLRISMHELFSGHTSVDKVPYVSCVCTACRSTDPCQKEKAERNF